MNNKINNQLSDEAMPVEVRLGYWTIALFILLLLCWAALVPLATGVIAPAVVSVEGDSKSVQHLTGGVVSKIHIKEGDLVSPGARLIALDFKPLESRYNALKANYTLLLARSARLEAESLGRSFIEYPDWLVQRNNEPAVAEAMRDQQGIFRSDLNLIREQAASFRHRINQAETQLSSDQMRLSGINKRAEAITTELKKYQQLLAQGLVTRSQIFSLDMAYKGLQDTKETIQGNIGSTQALIKQYTVEETESSMAKRNQSAKLLNALKKEIANTEKDLSLIEASLKQTVIRAPISGYIANLSVNTLGGVIAPGQTVMEIVPNNEKFIIKANVSTRDRPLIKVGQSAEIRFNAFNQSTTLPIKGEVVILSADRIMDRVTNTPYYSADIELRESTTAKLGGAVIHPGMQAEVIISTGERTALDYLVSPISQSFNRALREN